VLRSQRSGRTARDNGNEEPTEARPLRVWLAVVVLLLMLCVLFGLLMFGARSGMPADRSPAVEHGHLPVSEWRDTPGSAEMVTSKSGER
jgi:hypothetical protein